ncbi:MAG: hypothetical protein OXF47_02925 [Nitrospira sp.]|nr:hypothetical protein [Nitrospira sp.]
MKLAAFKAVACALRDANIRYLVVGGLAVNAHGYLRATGDVDLVIQLKPDNVIPAFRALAGLGYHPTVPVTAEQFADETERRQWIKEKGMTVLSLYSDQHPFSNVDVFVKEPFDFDSEYERALIGELSPDLFVRFVSIPALIAMKRIANRPRDLDDIEHLNIILNEENRGGSNT